MKIFNLKAFTFFLIATLALFTSCKKDNDVEPGDGTSGKFFSCTLDGAVYECASLFSYGVKNETDAAILVYGVQNDLDGTVYIQMPETTEVGTHVFSEEIYAYVSIGGKAYSTRFGTPEGIVTLTKKSGTHLEGTFKFTAYDSDDFETTMSVENGTFNVDFRE